MKQMLLWTAGAGTVLLALYVGLAIANIAQPFELQSERQEFSLLEWEDYREVASDVEPPVIREAEGTSGAILFFGAEHSNDPGHPQFAQIDEAFARFEPSVVLVEGRPGPIFWPFMDPVSAYGESGRLVTLARGAGSDVYIWELPREEEPALLRERFTQEQVAIYLLMRPFPGGSTPEEAESALSAIIEDRKGRPGIENVIGDLEQFEAAWRSNITTGEDWRDLSGIYGAPGFLGEMFEYGNDIRDQHLLNIVRELLADGERVMVTMGWSHTVRVEPAIAELVTSDE